MTLNNWSQPLIQDCADGLPCASLAIAVPNFGSRGIHQGNLETGTTEIDHKDEACHQRSTQLISI
ncbi:hypothetical protein SynROS8604_01959 [Synechococcus sp. ROS8604]|nr:hypothetical protein SynROS8604_01959 [Synechococcus sp. ROS8604]